MKVLNFLNHKDLAEFMIEMALNEGKTSYAVLFYEDARKLLKELSLYDDVEIDNIDLSEPMLKGYKKEFYVVLDDELHISIEEAWHDANEYHDACYYSFGYTDVIVLIHHEANSKIISAAVDCECYEIEINETDKDDTLNFNEKDTTFDFLGYLIDYLQNSKKIGILTINLS